MATWLHLRVRVNRGAATYEVLTYTMTAQMPSIEEIRRCLSWVEFLEPLSEEELDNLIGHAGFKQLEGGTCWSSAPRSKPSGC